MPGDINNIHDPGNSGLMLSCTIPASDTNSCAIFNHAPVMRFCTNKQFNLDFSATDADGDSLVYRFVNDYGSGTTLEDSPPQFPGSTKLLQYASSYSAFGPLGNKGLTKLNSATGHLTGICYKEGEYFIAVACDEYRKGKLINTVVRSLVYSFGDYEREVTAMVPITPSVYNFAAEDSVFISQCNGNRTVHFENTSIGAKSYKWYFGDFNNVYASSADSAPVYTYSASGKYLVTLVAFGANCSDTIKGYVLLSDDSIHNDFSISGGPCMMEEFQFSDNTNAYGNAVVQYGWSIGGQQFNGADVQAVINYPGVQKIIHVVTTAHGCISVLTKNLDVLEGHINAGNDTTVLTASLLVLNATGGANYLWTAMPSALNPVTNPTAANATILCTNSGRNMQYVLTGTDTNGCSAADTLVVNVCDHKYVYLPNAFTPNGDGLNDVLKPFLLGYTLDEMRIFNHSGQQVFYTTDEHNGWDGQFAGKPAPAEGYFWMINAHDKAGEKQTFKGNVAIIR
ncbi:T9SS type B sorting domain-containing protein [Taibaiella soli]|nr:gliding motility-associated C-terminal domain-containing protein [Taibaiella soli]